MVSRPVSGLAFVDTESLFNIVTMLETVKNDLLHKE